MNWWYVMAYMFGYLSGMGVGLTIYVRHRCRIDASYRRMVDVAFPRARGGQVRS